jgi:hypothetical protein
VIPPEDPVRNSACERHRVTAATIASAIRIADPVSHDKRWRTSTTSRVLEQVTDAEIMAAERAIDGVAGPRRPISNAVATSDARFAINASFFDGQRPRSRKTKVSPQGLTQGHKVFDLRLAHAECHSIVTR